MKIHVLNIAINICWLTEGDGYLKIKCGVCRLVERYTCSIFWPLQINNRTSPINRTRNLPSTRTEMDLLVNRGFLPFCHVQHPSVHPAHLTNAWQWYTSPVSHPFSHYQIMIIAVVSQFILRDRIMVLTSRTMVSLGADQKHPRLGVPTTDPRSTLFGIRKALVIYPGIPKILNCRKTYPGCQCIW